MSAHLLDPGDRAAGQRAEPSAGRTTGEVENADVVVIGSRLAGMSVAIELARTGRRVVAVDAAVFPSDTLSTHIVWPATVAELRDLGALDELLATRSPRLRGVHVEHGGFAAEGLFSPIGGIDYALCPRRTSLDSILVRTARTAGVDVREATTLTELIWDAGRVAGVRLRHRSGRTTEITCRLVVGADGRRSTVARLVGVGSPYRQDENGRGLVFAYVDDPGDDAERQLLWQWRVGDTLGNYFPTDDGAGIVLFMGPRADVAKFRPDLEHWTAMIAGNSQLHDRIGGGALRTRLRKASDTFSYFRRSAGPGWALVGDAGHFKDPVIAQGIRDAVHHGRRLGRAAAAHLDDPGRLDRALRRWELERDRDCLPTYYWGLRQTRTHPVSVVEAEAFREFQSSPAYGAELADVFGRRRRPRQLASIPRLAAWTVRGLRRPGTNRRAVLEDVVREAALTGAEWRDRALLATGRSPRATRPNPHHRAAANVGVERP